VVVFTDGRFFSISHVTRRLNIVALPKAQNLRIHYTRQLRNVVVRSVMEPPAAAAGAAAKME
jgi:hypothetical protein